MRKAHSILFRCDASTEIGFGHLVRCLALADEMHQGSGSRVGFALQEGALGSEVVRGHGYEVFPLPSKRGDYSAWLSETMRRFNATILIVDVRDDFSRQQLESLRGEGRLIVLLDDLSDRRFAVDLAFYPPVPQVRRADWADFSGERFVGWEWTILRSQFARPMARAPRSRGSLLIAMGGSDPAGLTLQAVRAIDLVQGDFDPVIVLGSGFQSRQLLQDLLSKSRRQFTVRQNVSDMRAEMTRADLAVCSFGMTAYELAATGVPAIYLCLTPDHAESASALDQAGMGRSLGIFSDLTDDSLGNAVERLFRDRSAREKMSTQARALMDGHGARRTAELLVDRASKL